MPNWMLLLCFKSSVWLQVEIVGKPQPATSSHPATPGTEHELKQYRKFHLMFLMTANK